MVVYTPLTLLLYIARCMNVCQEIKLFPKEEAFSLLEKFPGPKEGYYSYVIFKDP